jgi:putative phage-type endonuclease
MPITEKQREARKKRLGGSDIPILFGLNRFKSLYDLWHEKTGKLEDVPLNSEAAKAGTLFEDGVIQYAEEKLGKIRRNQYRSAKDLPIGTNIDGIVMETDEPVEIKVEGLFWKLREGWGDEGTDQCPYDVILQAHAHMTCQEADVCHVAAFLGGRGFCLYRIPRDEEIVQAIKEAAIDFWDNHVLADIPPKDDLPGIETLTRVIREPESTIEIDANLVNVWLAAVESRKIAEKTEETAKNAMLAAFGTAEAATCPLGTVTYYEQSRRGIDTKTFKAEQPELAAKYERTTTFRVPRFKAAKGE